ncbi:MdtA/MuxA family multidrug efflux RND transporter periplasmic adaptor subunit [Comamonas sp. J-3]|uniref:MdtA/MuxA family multidrug efflux RND transporter periplasmic adaptor subunit n=1 Tax=Comamonas trifloxystrobinivorans TaxID=3350256 RepID=UPI00372BA001
MDQKTNTTNAAPVSQPSSVTTEPPKPRRRWLGSTIAVLLVAALGGGAWYLVQGRQAGGAPGGMGGPGGPGGPGGMRAMTVTVGSAAVKRQSLPVTLTAMGTVVPTTTVTLTTQVSGILRDVLFTEGQMVKKGQKLAQIDPRPFEQALMQAKGQLARDQAQLDAARVTLKRYQTLWAQDSIARQDLDTQSATAKQLEGTVLADQAAVQTAQLNLGYTNITSPIDGRIGLRAIDPGNYVSAGGTTGIAVITKVAPIDVSFTVPQDHIPSVLDAQKQASQLAVVALDRAGSKPLATGQFLTLDNQVDTTTGTVKAKARFDNADGQLFPNQFVNTRLTLKDISSLVIPVTAIRTGGNGDFVYVINSDRTVSQRSVIRGMSTVELVAISSGLKEGELVVTEGADRLKDGASVMLQGDTPTQAPGASSGRRGARGEGGGRRGEGRPGEGRPGGGAPGAAPAAEGAVVPAAPAAAPTAPAAPAAPAASAAGNAPAQAK